MQILFLEDFKLNKCGDIINVKFGYAKNFLIPKFKAIILNKFLLKNLKKLILIIIKNDFIKKKFFQNLYNKINNKIINLYIKFCKIFNIHLYLKFILKKLGFLYYDYNILILKNLNLYEFLLKINVYNNINIEFCLYMKN